MKSIKWKIITIVLAIVVLISSTFGVASCVLNYRSAFDVLEKNMTETAEVASGRIDAELNNYLNMVEEIGLNGIISDASATLEEKEAVVNKKVAEYGLQRGNIIGMNGVSIMDGNDYSDREYFKESMNGNRFVSDPIVSKVTGKLTFIISAPIREGGLVDGSVVGVVYIVPNESFLNDIVKSIAVGEGGSAYILSKDGTTIAHRNEESVGSENTIEEAKSDPSLKHIAEIETKMVAGESGFGTYEYDGVKKAEAYTPVTGTNGWSLGVTIERGEFLAGVRQSILVTIIMVFVYIIVGFFLAARFARTLSRPITDCADRLKLLAAGDLKSEIPVTKAKDETGILLDGLGVTIHSLKQMIGDISYQLGAVAKGDLTLSDTEAYPGDFQEIQISLRSIRGSLNDTMRQINLAADQVSVGADQVADGAQALSQGATEQASSIEELAAALEDISRQVEKTTDGAQEAKRKTLETGHHISQCDEQMREMTAAMSEISSTSSEIGKIIKNIEDIAFQTNILALNAAVEAARAGEAGKGFAVVADEVRNLASKSAEAANDTTVLIVNSIKAVENGTSIVSKTAESLVQVVNNSSQVETAVDKITEETLNQSEALKQVTIGIDQISSVVQTNSATAEESAAASEEMTGQASMMKELVDFFKVK